jgi:ribosomal-protein-alanine N-acetyltransferase
MIGRDRPEVLAIDGEWDEPTLMRHMRERNIIGMVAETDDRVVGYMVYELSAERFSLIRFGVAPAWRHRGIGSQMIERLVGKLSTHRRREIVCTVNERDLPLLLFLKRMAFTATGIERDYFDDGDGIVMTYTLAAEVFGGLDE